jgi:hypothetical protein
LWDEIFSERANGLPPEGVIPPVDNPDGLTEGPPSKKQPRESGDRHLWEGVREWRYHPDDVWHNPHWDMKDHTRPNSEWKRIPIGGLPPLKPKC